MEKELSEAQKKVVDTLIAHPDWFVKPSQYYNHQAIISPEIINNEYGRLTCLQHSFSKATLRVLVDNKILTIFNSDGHYKLNPFKYIRTGLF
jgi:hypothetical protein